MNNSTPGKIWLARTIACGLALVSCGGCQLYRNFGTGEHYDNPPDRPVSEKSQRVRDIVLEVTTNAAGAVTTIQFKRSSGSPDLDTYVAESLRSDWQGGPSKRSVVELTYSGVAGFSDPKVLSISPAP